MGFARFYQLTHSPLDVALQQLLRLALGADLRVEVRAREPELITWLDSKLWLGDEAEFLPHGLAGGENDDLQPVLLTVREQVGSRTTCLMSVGGADVGVSEVTELSRTFVLFDGQDEAALNTARGQWSTLKEAGVRAEYWSQEEGGWKKKAETGPPPDA